MAIPNRVELRTETLACLEQGITRSDLMREEIAKRFGLDPLQHTFVNNHAWSLVDLQAQAAIRKVADGAYALADTSKVADTLVSNSAEPKRPSKTAGNQIVPPSDDTIPAWTRNLIGAANTRNAKSFHSAIRLTNEDLLILWDRCSGVCALSGLPFSGKRIGTGKAQRPFYPSLDRIDPEQPYSVENCRLVLQAVNFALNSYGDEVFLKIARATARAHSNE